MDNTNKLNKYYVLEDSLQLDLIKTIMNENVNEFKKLLSSPNFSLLEKNHVEASSFSIASVEFEFHNRKNILQYLIFELNISEEISLNNLSKDCNTYHEVKNMFDRRKIKEELEQELKISDTIHKSLKL